MPQACRSLDEDKVGPTLEQQGVEAASGLVAMSLSERLPEIVIIANNQG